MTSKPSEIALEHSRSKKFESFDELFDTLSQRAGEYLCRYWGKKTDLENF